MGDQKERAKGRGIVTGFRRALRLAACLFLVASLGALPVRAADRQYDPLRISPSVSAVWFQLDGANAFNRGKQPWLLGPSVRAVGKEPYREAPGGARTVYYFDKGRLDLNGDNSPAQLASLVRDLLSGQIQVGDQLYVTAQPASVPVAGDVSANPRAPTYAVLGRLASVGNDLAGRRQPNRIGQAVTTLLDADGTVHTDAVPDYGVTVGWYEPTLGHNVADVFWQWMQAQPLPWVTLTGLPLTDPYWVETNINGQPTTVLIQAFERRVLAYNPASSQGWQVTSENVGIHYRIWRQEQTPDDPTLAALARNVPAGEVLVTQALANGLDPYYFVALAELASHFDPLAQTGNGIGLLGLPRDVAASLGNAAQDPTANAQLAAKTVASLRGNGDDDAAWGAYLQRAGIAVSLDTLRQTANAYRARFAHPSEPPSATTYRLIGQGQAAFYSPNYTRQWWDSTLQSYASWGGATPGAQPDPNGYYCVHPDFRPGQRLLLIANGRALWCTIGDTVSPGDVPAWRSKWVIELAWDTFQALGLNNANWVAVYQPS